MYKDIQTFSTRYKHTPTLQTGKTAHGDSIYRCNGCGTVAFVTKNNDVYGYGTKTICSRPLLSVIPHTLTGINVEIKENIGSTVIYYLPNELDLPMLMAQLAAMSASHNHKMEPLDPHPAFAHITHHRVDGIRCSICKAPITGGIHRSTTIDGEPITYVMLVSAWALTELCRGYYLDKQGNAIYPTPTFPAVNECTLLLTGEVLDLCDSHKQQLSEEILETQPLEHPVECVLCVRAQKDQATVYIS